MNRNVSRRNVLSIAASGITLGAMCELPLASAARQCNADTYAAPLRWGVIGTGIQGAYKHIPALGEAPESQLIAVCDVSEDRLAAGASRAGLGVKMYTDYQKLLGNPDVNAVVIATPTFLHREMVLAALGAGKHVLCESPVGVNRDDAVAVKLAVHSTQHIVMFGMQMRNMPRQRKIRELIESNEIGTPHYIVQNYSCADWKTNSWKYLDPQIGEGPVNWRHSHAASGGSLNEAQGHFFDLLHWFAGALPERVSATGGLAVYRDGRNTMDHATVTLTYPNDLTAVHNFCLFGPGHNETRIMGNKGTIIDRAGEPLRLTRFTRRGAGSARVYDIRVADSSSGRADQAILGLYGDFLACVKTGKAPEANVDRAVGASRTCWLADAAVHCRAEFRWDA